ncbi:hypothetical protein D3C84_795960 [compost metagenome]
MLIRSAARSTSSQVSRKNEAWWNLPFSACWMNATSWAFMLQVRNWATRVPSGSSTCSARSKPSTSRNRRRVSGSSSPYSRAWSKRVAFMPLRPRGQASGLISAMPHLPVCSFSANSSKRWPVGALKRMRRPQPFSSPAGMLSTMQPKATRSSLRRPRVASSSTLKAMKSMPASSASRSTTENLSTSVQPLRYTRPLSSRSTSIRPSSST